MESTVNYYSFLIVKLFAITYYSVIYFILGFSTSILLNRAMPGLNEKKKEDTKEKIKDDEKTTILIILEIIINFALIGISFYLVRKIVKKYIPFPFEGVFGFQKDSLKEIQGGIIIASIYMSFQTKLVSKLNYLKQKLN
jgi:hypothetical protein